MYPQRNRWKIGREREVDQAGEVCLAGLRCQCNSRRKIESFNLPKAERGLTYVPVPSAPVAAH